MATTRVVAAIALIPRLPSTLRRRPQSCRTPVALAPFLFSQLPPCRHETSQEFLARCLWSLAMDRHCPTDRTSLCPAQLLVQAGPLAADDSPPPDAVAAAAAVVWPATAAAASWMLTVGNPPSPVGEIWRGMPVAEDALHFLTAVPAAKPAALSGEVTPEAAEAGMLQWEMGSLPAAAAVVG